jgi:hypothetical protein
LVWSQAKIPTFVVIGLLNSVFKGRMDALKAWNTVVGSVTGEPSWKVFLPVLLTAAFLMFGVETAVLFEKL